MSWSYLEDASGAKGFADRICVPASEAELIAVLQEAEQQQVPVTIAGGGSGLTGGRVPFGGWLISMEKFRRLDIHTGSATVGSGVTLHDLHAAAKATGQFYPPDPTETMAYLGGTIAANSSGSRSFKYGATRRWIQRLRVALVDGRVLDVRRGDPIDFEVPAIPQPASRKHSAGYQLQPGMDWIDLFCGSEGTLGIVIEADVELLPNPQELLNGIIFFPSDEACLDALDQWRDVANIRMLEYVDDPALRMIEQRYPDVPKHARAAIITEQIIHSDSDIDAWADRLEQAGALEKESWFGSSDFDRERFRKFRHALPETALSIAQKNGFPSLGTDFSVPIDRNREMLAFYRQHMDRIMPGHYCIFGHVGDAHPHVNMLPATRQEFDAGTDALLLFAQKAASLGGSVSAEHGLGKRKAKLLAVQYTPDQIDAMKAVKRRLDPHWRLGPGTFFEQA
jgi:FAD/FMN-containing dehydrogenase